MTLNALLPEWEASLADFSARHGIAAVVLYPSYHSYELTDPRVDGLLHAAAERQLPVLIPLRLEDERSQHWRLQVPAVPMAELRTLALAHPHTSILALNAYHWEMNLLAADTGCPPNLRVDFAYYERPDSLAQLASVLAAEHIVFGSATPFLVTEAALAKLRSGTAPDSVRRQIAANAEAMVPELMDSDK